MNDRNITVENKIEDTFIEKSLQSSWQFVIKAPQLFSENFMGRKSLGMWLKFINLCLSELHLTSNTHKLHSAANDISLRQVEEIFRNFWSKVNNNLFSEVAITRLEMARKIHWNILTSKWKFTVREIWSYNGTLMFRACDTNF